MSIALANRVAALEEDFGKLSDDFQELRAEHGKAISNMDSVAVQRAIERPPILIPPAPRCLRELGLV